MSLTVGSTFDGWFVGRVESATLAARCGRALERVPCFNSPGKRNEAGRPRNLFTFGEADLTGRLPRSFYQSPMSFSRIVGRTTSPKPSVCWAGVQFILNSLRVAPTSSIRFS